MGSKTWDPEKKAAWRKRYYGGPTFGASSRNADAGRMTNNEEPRW